MSNRRIANFNQKGFTKNFLQLMKTKEQQNECCTNYNTPGFTYISSNYTLSSNDDVIIVDTSLGNVTISVNPSLLGKDSFKIKKLGTDVNSVIISMLAGSIYADSGAQASYTFSGPGAAIELQTDGTNAYVL